MAHLQRPAHRCSLRAGAHPRGVPARALAPTVARQPTADGRDEREERAARGGFCQFGHRALTRAPQSRRIYARGPPGKRASNPGRARGQPASARAKSVITFHKVADGPRCIAAGASALVARSPPARFFAIRSSAPGCPISPSGGGAPEGSSEPLGGGARRDAGPVLPPVGRLPTKKPGARKKGGLFRASDAIRPPPSARPRSVSRVAGARRASSGCGKSDDFRSNFA